MTRYSYLAVDVDGRQRRGGLDAPSEAAARAALKARKLLPLEVVGAAHEPVRALAPSARASKRALTHKERLLLTRQLATLIQAAVPVDDALAVVAAQEDKAAARRVLSDVQTSVQSGLRLSEALARQGASFPPLYRAAVTGGERTGRLGPVLNRLADHLSRDHAMRSRVLAAMVYPAALAAVSVIVVVCLMIFVVPPLVEQFSTLNVRLPWLTRVLIGLSEGLVAFWPALLVGVMAVTLAGRLALRQSGPRLAFDRAVLRAPVIGRRAASLNASRFIRSVSTLTASGLPVLDSVRAAKGSTSNRHFAAEIDDIAISIERGESLSTAMRRSRALPGIAIYMAASGESSGELSLMLEKAADYLDQETESTLQMLLSLLEPAVIIVMGLVVAGIVMAIMLPILQLNQLAIA